MATIIKPNTEYTSYDTTSAAETVTLTAIVGKCYEIKNTGTGSNALTVNYGTDTATLSDGSCGQFTYDGSGWCAFIPDSIQEEVDALEVRVGVNEGDISDNANNITTLDTTLAGAIVTVSASTSYEITSTAFRIILDASTVSASGQIITFTEGTGATRKNIIQVYNGSAESVTVTDGTTSFTLTAGQYASFFFQDSALEQETTIADITGQAVSTILTSMTGDLSTTIEELVRTVVIEDTVTSSYTLTLSAGTGVNETRYCYVKNKSDELQYVTDGTTTYTLKAGQKAKFRIDDGDLIWSSAGWESLWLDTSYSSYTVSFATMSRTPVLGQRFKGYVLAGGSNYSWVGDYLSETLTNGCSYAASSFLAIKGTGLTSEFAVTDTSHDLKSVELWHNGE